MKLCRHVCKAERDRLMFRDGTARTTFVPSRMPSRGQARLFPSLRTERQSRCVLLRGLRGQFDSRRPRLPIEMVGRDLCTIESSAVPCRKPLDPSCVPERRDAHSLPYRMGTTNALMPRLPAADGFVIANTMTAPAICPEVMNCLVPVISYPLDVRTARVSHVRGVGARVWLRQGEGSGHLSGGKRFADTFVLKRLAGSRLPESRRRVRC